MRGIKRDGAARTMYPRGAYAAIPKSVFAAIAWHLANHLQGEGEHGTACKMILDEWDALNFNEIIPQKAPDSLRALLTGRFAS